MSEREKGDKKRVLKDRITREREKESGERWGSVKKTQR